MVERLTKICFKSTCKINHALFMFQSCIRVKDNKFVELHKDKNDPTLDAEMVREINDNNELIVVCLLQYNIYMISIWTK